MRSDELTALGDLAGDALAGLTTQVQATHRGIAQRVFGSIGVAAKPVQLAHDGIAMLAYSSTRMLAGNLVRAGGRLAGAALAPDARSLHQARAGRLALAALNGAVGDGLERSHSPLAVRMSIRHADRDIAPTAAELAGAFPAATPRLAVFVHGLGQGDGAWRFASERHPPYGVRLRAELGYTPLYVRYNSGRHISENGQELAELLDRVLEAWPVAVQEIALVGHSMGALVARSACHYGAEQARWTPRVRQLVALGAPHGGTALEQLLGAAGAALARLPETRGLAGSLNARSAGSKDLGRGHVVEEDWSEQDPRAIRPQTGSRIPFLPDAEHYFVSASLTRSPDAPVGRLVGDLLVRRASAWGQDPSRALRFPVDHYRHLGGAHHFDLLNHPAVYEQIAGWLGRKPALPAPVRELPAGDQRP
jgi:pimeloyl-ACP methyl ester carboxylesterase